MVFRLCSLPGYHVHGMGQGGNGCAGTNYAGYLLHRVRHPEGFLTPTAGPLIGITSEAHIGHPIIYDCQRFKRVTSLGLSETMWPQPHQAIIVKTLALYESGKIEIGNQRSHHRGAVFSMGSRDFYALMMSEPSGPLKAPSYRPNSVMLAWQESLGQTEPAMLRAVCSNTRLKFPLLPAEKMHFQKLMRKGHVTGSRNADKVLRRCQVGCSGDTDNS